MSIDRITKAAIEYSDNLANSTDPIMVIVATEAYKAGARWMREIIGRKFNESGGDFDFVEWWLDKGPNDDEEEEDK